MASLNLTNSDIGSRITVVAATLVGLAYAIFAGAAIVGDRFNAIATFNLLVLPPLFLVGACRPNAGIYLLIFLTAISDLFKKLMSTWGDFGMMDIAASLMLCPIIMLGILIGTLAPRIFQADLFTRRELPIVVMMLAIQAMTFVGAMHGGEGFLKAGQSFIGAGTYVVLIVVLPILLTTREKVFSLLRWTIFCFLAVGVYGLWQYVFGFAQFEEDYARSGLTMLVKEFDAGDQGRIFSTLNSNHAFALAMATCALFSLAYSQISQLGGHFKRRLWPAVWFLFFTSMTIISLRRTAWAMLALALVAAFFFATPRRVQVFYASSIIALILLFTNSDYINQNWQKWQSYMPASSNFQEQAFRIGTFTDRVNSYKNTLNDKELHTLFGLPRTHPRRRGSATGVVSHDAIGDVLVNYGMVGLTLIGACVAVCIVIIHRLQFSLKDRAVQDVVRLLMGILVAHVFTSIVFQAHINIFPLNVLFWMTFGLLITFFRRGDDPSVNGLDAFLNFKRWQQNQKPLKSNDDLPVVANIGRF